MAAAVAVQEPLVEMAVLWVRVLWVERRSIRPISVRRQVEIMVEVQQLRAVAAIRIIRVVVWV
jgi:hypothetical protein